MTNRVRPCAGNISSTNTTELDKTASIIQSWICVLLIVAGLFLNILVLLALARSSNEMFNKSVNLIISNILFGCVLICVTGLIMRSMTLICGYFNFPPSIGHLKIFKNYNMYTRQMKPNSLIYECFGNHIHLQYIYIWHKYG